MHIDHTPEKRINRMLAGLAQLSIKLVCASTYTSTEAGTAHTNAFSPIRLTAFDTPKCESLATAADILHLKWLSEEQVKAVYNDVAAIYRPMETLPEAADTLWKETKGYLASVCECVSE